MRPLLSGWTLTSCRQAGVADRSGETTLWTDQSSPLSVSKVVQAGIELFRLRYGDSMCVDLLPGRRLRASVTKDVSQRELDHFIADQVIPRTLADAGHLVLHGGAVRRDTCVALVVGVSGRGKSTLCASFGESDLLGDDAMIVSLGEDVEIRAVYRSLRLLPDSLFALYGSSQRSVPIADDAAKHEVTLPTVAGSADVGRTLNAIFILDKRDDHGAISCRTADPAEACMAVTENSFALDPSNIGQARQRLDRASLLVSRIPVFMLNYPRDYARLPEVRAVMIAKMEGC